MKATRPTARDLFDAFAYVEAELKGLEDLTSVNPTFKSHPWLTRSRPKGFLGLLPPSDEETKQFTEALAEGIRQEVIRITIALSANQTINWVQAQSDYVVLQKGLQRQATLKKGGSFDQPKAQFNLLKATLISIGGYYKHIDHGKTPGSMSSRDWDKAIAAVKTLKELEMNNGLRLWKAMPSSMGNGIGWFGELEARLVQEKGAARKPYDDGLSSDRAAARRFTEWLLIYFDEAPPSLVEKFARLIGYDTTSIPRQVKAWEQALRSDSLT